MIASSMMQHMKEESATIGTRAMKAMTKYNSDDNKNGTIWRKGTTLNQEE